MAKHAGPQLLSVVGHSGSGKTHLIESLIPSLRARGLRVGVLKHDAHVIELDKPGKDTFRFREAGAEVVAIASRKMVFLASPRAGEQDPDELVETLFPGFLLDLVLVEGYSLNPRPKLEVVHPERGPRLDPAAANVVAWICRRPCPEAPVPVFEASELEGILGFLVARGLVPAGPRG